MAPIRRHEDNCKACFEPWDCDCTCATCIESRKKYLSIITGYATRKELNPEEKEKDDEKESS